MEEHVSFEELKGALASLLLLWSKIEKVTRAEIARTYDGQVPKSAYGIANSLNAWVATIENAENTSPFSKFLALKLREQLQHPLNIRNGLCHGLAGVSASQDNKPASLTWEMNDETGSVTWQELQIIFAWLSKIPIAIRIISSHRHAKVGSRLVDNSENRDWWNSEFGLKGLETR
ncbi:hypothetical protein RPE78_12400 [Thioclava litoralis]|uniref:MAE-28990/MAE-18760-like HEPN domain-containing protein n=1 Tax=Thioclava litoralis TaxID=3076557 RepID=A0ABZ1DXG6_9RHOB|nr:hypothetical protein RPE78_12400 [Thioclava sp. FTW29]